MNKKLEHHRMINELNEKISNSIDFEDIYRYEKEKDELETLFYEFCMKKEKDESLEFENKYNDTIEFVYNVWDRNTTREVAFKKIEDDIMFKYSHLINKVRLMSIEGIKGDTEGDIFKITIRYSITEKCRELIGKENINEFLNRTLKFTCIVTEPKAIKAYESKGVNLKIPFINF